MYFFLVAYIMTMLRITSLCKAVENQEGKATARASLRAKIEHLCDCVTVKGTTDAALVFASLALPLYHAVKGLRFAPMNAASRALDFACRNVSAARGGRKDG